MWPAALLQCAAQQINSRTYGQVSGAPQRQLRILVLQQMQVANADEWCWPHVSWSSDDLATSHFLDKHRSVGALYLLLRADPLGCVLLQLFWWQQLSWAWSS
jgi:hypothetical protein